MCQLSYIHLKDNELNKLLFLLMGSFGSVVHDDGWGVVNSRGESWKCELPMGFTFNAGEVVAEKFSKEYSPLMGHIRLASANIPVTEENAHPFRSKSGQILFAHNGGLKPIKAEDFVLEYEVEVLNKQNVKVKEKIKISDSIIFFDKFQELFTEGKSFEAALNETMALFYGKFAFMFYNVDTKKFHIARGKTADLFITYLLESSEQNANVIGYAVNTSKDVLEMCTNLLNNIWQLQHGKELCFSKVTLLPAETIYEAGDDDLIKTGEIKENYAPVSSYSGATTFRGNYTNTNSDIWEDWTQEKEEKITKATTEAQLAETVLLFMEDFCLSFRDIQFMMSEGYETSTLEVTEATVRHFVETVIPRTRSKIPRDIRKEVHRLMKGSMFSSVHYANKELMLEYPWMYNTPKKIQEMVQFLKRESDGK